MFDFIKDLIGVLNKKQRKELYFLQVFVVFTAIAEVVSLASIGPFMALVGNSQLIKTNELINNIYVYFNFTNPMEFLFVTGLCVLFLLFISSAISVITITKLSFFAARTGAELGDTLYEYYLNKDYLFHTKVNSSHLIKQIATEVARVTDHILQPFVQINARIIATIFISVAIFIYDPIISISGLLVILIAYIILFMIVKGRLSRNGINISNVSRKRFSLMNEGFGSIKDVKVLNRQKYFIEQFKASGVIFSQAYGSSNSLYNVPRYVMEFIVYSGMVVLILTLLHFSSNNISEVLPVLAIFGMAAFKLLPSFQQIYGSAAQIKSNSSAFHAIKKDVLNARGLNKVPVLGSELRSSKVGLNLRDISFTYPNSDKKAISELTIEIPKNSTIGIVGPSGSGKSTLLDVLLGLINPDSGGFYSDDQIIDKNYVTSWQKKIGYVPQNIFIKDGDVIENIAFGLTVDQVDKNKLSKALELAQLTNWVESLPSGLSTNLGERGVQISGGQKQRIGIARALYENAEYLFLDEATSALDGGTEHLIMDAIDKISGSKTIVMIAHRINTVMKCDIIYIINEGRVVDSGTYNYLIENNSEFKKMAEGMIND